MLISAQPVNDTMFRGTEYTLRVEIKDEDGDVYDITDCTLKLRLARSWTDDNSLLELTGQIADAESGKAFFVFVPANTQNLVARAYDMTVTVTSPTSQPWVAIQGKFGVLPQNPEVS